MTRLLTLASYGIFVLFVLKVLWYIFQILKAEGVDYRKFHKGPPVKGYLRGLFEVMTMGRLFRANPLMWFGQWLFHISFVMLLIEHMRFFLFPVPAVSSGLYPFGGLVGLMMMGSLAYIGIVKIILKKVNYLHRDNLILIILAALMGASGLAMKYIHKVDIISVKGFTMGLITLRPEQIPLDVLFVFHYTVFLIFLLKLPSHVFVAPLLVTFTTAEQQKSC